MPSGELLTALTLGGKTGQTDRRTDTDTDRQTGVLTPDRCIILITKISQCKNVHTCKYAQTVGHFQNCSPCV